VPITGFEDALELLPRLLDGSLVAEHGHRVLPAVSNF